MGTRMRIEVYLADVGAVEVRVELRGRDAGVTEQFLHDSKVRATLQKVRGEGVSQGVVLQPIDSRQAPVELNYRLYGLQRDSVSAYV